MKDRNKCGCYIERPIQKQISDFVRGYLWGRTGRLLEKGIETYLRGYCLGTKEVEECTCDGDPRKCNFYAYKRGEI